MSTNWKKLAMNIVKYCVVIGLILAASLALPSFALADAISGPISNVAYDQQNPHTIFLLDQGVADDEGNKFGLWLTVWEDWRNRAVTGADIRGQFIRDDGSFCGNSFIITNSKGNQTVPRASYRQDISDPTKSKVVVVWQDTRSDYIYYKALSNFNAAANCTFNAGTERPIGYNEVRVHSDTALSYGDVADELLGTVPPTEPPAVIWSGISIAGTLKNFPIVPGSIKVTFMGENFASDNGKGNIIGEAVGTVDYGTGNIKVVGIDIPGGHDMTVAYTYYKSSEVVEESIGYGNGTAKDFRSTLAIAPVIPGTLSVTVGGVLTAIEDDDAGRLIPTIATTGEAFETADGSSTTFTKTLSHYPVKQSTVVIKADGAAVCSDKGLTAGCTVEVDYTTGFVKVFFDTAPAEGVKLTVDYNYYAGTINYNSGVVSLAFAAAPASGEEIVLKYDYKSFPPAKISAGDRLLARMNPRIAYDQTSDRFWIVWKETRSILHQLSEVCFASVNPAIADWSFDDSDFIGYVRLQGETLFEQNSVLDVVGADIIRNADNTTVRQVKSLFEVFEETREYESFNLVSNPDVACDDTSTQCLIVSEGLRTKQTMTCICADDNNNKTCDLADPVTTELTSAPFDDNLVHIYGLSDNYVTRPIVSSTRIDSGTSYAHYPAVGFDPITKRFLTAWEDFRGGANTKVYGQLVLSGGGLYNDNFIISYKDTNNDLANDANVVNTKQTKPSISYDGVNQRFFVVWQDGRNSTLSLENLDIYGQKIDAEGSLRGANYAILTQAGNQYSPAIAYNELTDTYLAVWKDARNFSKRTCTATSSTSGRLPCGSDVYGQLFYLGQPSLTLLKMDNTALTPSLLNEYENPAGSGYVSVGLFDAQSFKIVNTGDTTIEVDHIYEDLSCNGAIASTVGPPVFTRDISPFSFDGLPSELLDRIGQTANKTLNLVPGASVTMTVRFTPLSAGSYNKCFIIESNGGNQQVNLAALAVEPNITISPATGNFNTLDTFHPLDNDKGIYIGNSADLTFVVKNTGVINLDITALNPPPAPFTIVTDGCSGKSIASGSTCSIVARYTPTVPGVTDPAASFGIKSNDPDTPTLKVLLSGRGLGSPSITITPLSLDFGNVQVDQTAEKTITIKNDGTMNTLQINSISVLAAPFSILNSNCLINTDMAVNDSCNVVVKFAPTASGGTSASITIASNDPAPDKSPKTVSIVGTGITTPTLSASPASLTFLNVPIGTTVQQEITVENTGTADLLISSVAEPESEFSVISNSCFGTVTPDSTCTITVVFNPISSGFKQSSLSLVSNDPANPTTIIPMTGTVKVAPLISATPASAAFGNVVIGGTPTITFVIKNTGTGNLLISAVNSIEAPFTRTADTCTGATLAPMTQTCSVTVKYSPTAAVTSTASLVISSNDPVGGGQFTLPLSGTGVTKPVSDLSPATWSFGNVKIGTTSASKTFTLKNTASGSVLTVNSVTYPSVPFRVLSNTCTTGKSLAYNETCSVSVEFRPIKVATYNPYFLTFRTNDPVTPLIRATLSGTGIR